MRASLVVLALLLTTPALARPAASTPASSPAASVPASASAAARTPAAEEEVEEEEQPEPPPPRWSLTASVGVTGGYNDNISVSNLVRPGEQVGSWTTEISGRIKPALRLIPHLKARLGYSFDQSIYYAESNLNTQSHALTPSLKWSSERLDLALSYGFSVHALIPKNTLYSLEHEPKLSTEVLVKGPFYVGLEYRFHYYDVRDPDYLYLKGQIHTVELYPELYFEEKLVAYLGYKLGIARLGEQSDSFQGGQQGQVTIDVTSAQSYNGHFGFLHVSWLPHERLTLTVDAELGRKSYFDSTVRGGGQGPGAGKQVGYSRVDTVVSVSFTPSWRFWRGFSLDGYFGYEKSSSSVKSTALASSYDNLVGSLGLSWEHP
jgi:hypothetical protein